MNLKIVCENIINNPTDFDVELLEKMFNDYAKYKVQEYQPDLKLIYKNDERCGSVAQKYKMTVGEIGCGNCGCSVHGALTNDHCLFCGTKYFINNDYENEM